MFQANRIAPGFFVALAFVHHAVVADDTDSPDADAPVVHHYFSKTDHEHDADWGYTGERGPKFWATLSPNYRIAKDGRQQSPIDIRLSDTFADNLPPLKFEYRKERATMINNGHSIQHNEQPGSFLHVGSLTFALHQFHVHVPSEHTIDGRHADMEIHFVHQSKSGQVAVVAVFANAGTTDPVELPLHKDLPQQVGEQVEVENRFLNPLEFLPKNHAYLTYTGSFTTPPCTEGVRWIVMTSPLPVTPETLKDFQTAIGGNNRPVQPRFDRRLARSRHGSAVDE